jgi:hypothetical protein
MVVRRSCGLSCDPVDWERSCILSRLFGFCSFFYRMLHGGPLGNGSNPHCICIHLHSNANSIFAFSICFMYSCATCSFETSGPEWRGRSAALAAKRCRPRAGSHPHTVLYHLSQLPRVGGHPRGPRAARQYPLLRRHDLGDVVPLRAPPGRTCRPPRRGSSKVAKPHWLVRHCRMAAAGGGHCMQNMRTPMGKIPRFAMRPGRHAQAPPAVHVSFALG